MSKPKLTVGLIGYQFMGKAHSNAYRQAGRFFDLPMDIRMKTICGRTESRVKAAADTFGWETYATDWRKVIEDPEIDVIDVATPGNMHAEIAIAAAEAGKTVFCEKPIGNTLAEAQAMLDASKKSGVRTLVFHNYRFAPAQSLIRKMIDDGKLGKIFHVRAVYLQDWIVDPSFPLVWRLQKEVAGSGSHGDLNAHLIDSARFLVGEFESVVGDMKTFVKERPLVAEIDDKLGGKASDEMGEVTVDDATTFLARFKNGAIGTFEATRFATGNNNGNKIEINGEKGSVIFDMRQMNELQWFDRTLPAAQQGFATIEVSGGGFPYTDAYWPPAHIIGYEHTFVNLIADAVKAIAEDKPFKPDFEDGFQNQRVLDAVERSAASGSWISL